MQSKLKKLKRKQKLEEKKHDAFAHAFPAVPVCKN